MYGWLSSCRLRWIMIACILWYRKQNNNDRLRRRCARDSVFREIEVKGRPEYIKCRQIEVLKRLVYYAAKALLSISEVHQPFYTEHCLRSTLHLKCRQITNFSSNGTYSQSGKIWHFSLTDRINGFLRLLIADKKFVFFNNQMAFMVLGVKKFGLKTQERRHSLIVVSYCLTRRQSNLFPIFRRAALISKVLQWRR